MSYVVPILHAVEANAIDDFVGALLRRAHVVPERSHAQHATAIHDHAVVLKRSACVKYVIVVAVVWKGVDGIAFARILRIAVRGKDDTERNPRIPLYIHAVKRAIERAFDQRNEIGLETQQYGLGFRVAHATVELEYFQLS